MAAKALPRLFGLDLSILQSNTRAYFDPNEMDIMNIFCTKNAHFQNFLTTVNRPTITNLRTYNLHELYEMLGFDYETLKGAVNHEGQPILPMLDVKIKSKITRDWNKLHEASTAGSASASSDSGREQSETPGVVINNYQPYMLKQSGRVIEEFPNPNTGKMIYHRRHQHQHQQQQDDDDHPTLTQRASSMPAVDFGPAKSYRASSMPAAADINPAKSDMLRLSRASSAGAEEQDQDQGQSQSKRAKAKNHSHSLTAMSLLRQEQLMAVLARKQEISLMRRKIEKEKENLDANADADADGESDNEGTY
ncbi:hypothetical protein LZ554_009596 [Drepanopeziza brunnea f. sp. 'monogermtubi']|nr:hypothetical protein LZ554_009596 [Drepanopeziza brunnea f. sp. 'monogermtubi']